MARPQIQTVSYFPHYTEHKKTLFIIEKRFGDTGYVFWFKLLEVLGKFEKHYLDFNNEYQKNICLIM